MIDDRTMSTVTETILAKRKPEAAGFMAYEGKRCGMAFFDMAEAADRTGAGSWSPASARAKPQTGGRFSSSLS